MGRTFSFRRLLTIPLIGLLLIVLHIPFHWTSAIQEDAYITLRCAVNLANTCVYGFNPGEKISASTSHAYVFLAAAVYHLTPKSFIPTLTIINSCLLILASYLLASVLFNDFWRRTLLWIFICCSPLTLRIAYAGMEYCLLLLMVSIIVQSMFQERTGPHAYFAMMILPWVRPDAIAFGGILIISLAVSMRRMPLTMGFSLLVGLISWLCFNYYYFDSPVTQSMIAKGLRSQSLGSLPSFVQNLERIFFGFRTDLHWGIGGSYAGIFTPINTRYLEPYGIFFFFLTISIFIYYLVLSRHNTERLLLLGTLIGMALVPPIAYAMGGVVWAWYLWPSSFFGLFVVAAALVDLMSSDGTQWRRTPTILVCVLLLASTAGEWCLAYRHGTQEMYRKQIGKYLKDKAQESDTLLLEPAGYIPFFSGMYVYDEVGLTSPQITDYISEYGKKWWIEFLEDMRPTFLLERSHIVENKTLQGYELPPMEKEWFHNNYELIHVFKFDPETYIEKGRSIGILSDIKRFLIGGTRSDFYLYRLRDQR
jgi:hypothetical protein